MAMRARASLFQESGQLEEAEALYKEAIALGERAFGTGHPDLAVCYNNLAALLKTKGQLDRAEPYLLRSLQICERSLDKSHEGFRVVLSALVDLEIKRGRPVHARRWAKTLIPLLERFEGTEAAYHWRQRIEEGTRQGGLGQNCTR